MSIFKKTPMGVPRKELKEVLRRTPDLTGRLTPQERVTMEKSVFPQSFGGEISRLEFSSRLGVLKQQRLRVRDLKQKAEIESKIKLLERLKRK